MLGELNKGGRSDKGGIHVFPGLCVPGLSVATADALTAR